MYTINWQSDNLYYILISTFTFFHYISAPDGASQEAGLAQDKNYTHQNAPTSII